MAFSCKKYFFWILSSTVLLCFFWSTFGKYFSQQSFSYAENRLAAQHSLPSSIQKKFHSFFEKHDLNASFFKSSEEVIEKKLASLGFEKTTTGSNSLVVKCPATLGNFILKAPGRFHNVTRGIVDVPLENITRVVGSDRIKKCVKKNELKHIKVLDEYLFNIPGAPKSLSDYHYLVIEPFIEIDETKDFKSLSFKQFKEVVDVIYDINYSDTTEDNIVFDTKGSIYFLDTSERDYLEKYENLPENLCFSYSSYSSKKKSTQSHEKSSEQESSMTSYEELIGDTLLVSCDENKKQAGRKICKDVSLFFHGLLPLAENGIDNQKKLYLRQQLQMLVQRISERAKPFVCDIKKTLKKDKVTSLNEILHHYTS